MFTNAVRTQLNQCLNAGLEHIGSLGNVLTTSLYI